MTSKEQDLNAPPNEWGCKGREQLARARGGLDEHRLLFRETAMPGQCPELIVTRAEVEKLRDCLAALHRCRNAENAARQSIDQSHADICDLLRRTQDEVIHLRAELARVEALPGRARDVRNLLKVMV